MKDFKIEEGYGILGSPFSCNVTDKCIYLHWDCWTERSNEEWYKHQFQDYKTKQVLNFIDYIYYALLHEELHLVLFKLGEEDYRFDEKENIIHCDLITNVLISIIKDEWRFMKQHYLDRWC